MSSPQLDWTFGPAPEADEAPPGLAPRSPRPSPAAARRLSRRTWLLLGALAALALVLTATLPALQLAWARRAVEQVVARQEQARLAGDWAGLSATYAADSLGWAPSRLSRQRRGWLPTPISLPGLQPDGQPGRVTRFQVVGPQLARAEVTRGFVLADGTPVAFAMPQYYQFTQGTWRQAPPPDVPRDRAQHFHGTWVDVTYYPDDADWAPSLARELDDLLGQACADWACPPQVRVAVGFDPSDPASAASAAPYESLFGSLTFQILLGRPSSYPTDGVTLATRVTGGYPADAAAAEAVRRAAGVRALILAAQQLAPNLLLHGENAYLDALIAREAARLGIDEPGLGQFQIAGPLSAPDDLWSVPRLHMSSAAELPEALVILNHLLAGRSLADEQRLMHVFSAAPDAESWLASGLNLPRDTVRAALSAGLEASFPTVPAAGFTPDFALSCRARPLLGTLGGQVAPLLDGNFPDSTVGVWSPDGQRLALRISGRLGVVDLEGRTGQFLPQASSDGAPPPAWASNMTVVYPTSGSSQVTTAPADIGGLAYVGLSSHPFVEIARTDLEFVPSPDRQWDALLAQPPGSELTLFVTPSVANSGKLILQAVMGYNPAWSADSQRLAFALNDPNSSSLVVFDMASRDKHTLATWDDPSGAPAYSTSLLPAWSPGGDRLAVASVSDTGSGYTGWVGTLRPDGSDFKRLPDAQTGMAPATLAYSADGSYLAVEWFDASGRQDVALYNAAGALLRWLPGYQLQAWSPAGHRLALVGMDGVSLLSEPQAAPQRLGPEGCTGLAWKP